MNTCCNTPQCQCQPEQHDANDQARIQWLQEQNETLKRLYIHLKAEYDSKFKGTIRYRTAGL